MRPAKPIGMRILLYLFGSLILLGAICYGATLIGVPQVWVVVIGAVILGLGIIGAANTRGPSSSNDGPSTVINKIQ